MHLALFAGDLEGTEEMVARTVVAAQEAGDPWAESFSLAIAAILESDRGNFDRSMEVARKARDVALTSTDPNASQPLALAVRMLAYGTLQNGDLPLSSRLFEQAVALRRDADESGRWESCSRISRPCACCRTSMKMPLRLRERRWGCAEALVTIAASLGRCKRSQCLKRLQVGPAMPP